LRFADGLLKRSDGLGVKIFLGAQIKLRSRRALNCGYDEAMIELFVLALGSLFLQRDVLHFQLRILLDAAQMVELYPLRRPVTLLRIAASTEREPNGRQQQK